jgi:hypothetical protein
MVRRTSLLKKPSESWRQFNSDPYRSHDVHMEWLQVATLHGMSSILIAVS